MASEAPIQVDRLYRYLYADDPDETPDIATVHSHVSKLRSKLKTRGVALRQMRNTGYWIESDGRRRVLDLFTDDVSSITIEVPTWVPDDLRVEYDRHARRFGEFYAAARHQASDSSRHTRIRARMSFQATNWAQDNRPVQSQQKRC